MRDESDDSRFLLVHCCSRLGIGSLGRRVPASTHGGTQRVTEEIGIRELQSAVVQITSETVVLAGLHLAVG